MQSVRPAFMDEYEKLEKELVEEYEIYLERFRNLDFLEHELDACQRAEREKLEASDRALKKLQKKLRDEELRMFIGDQVRCSARTPPAFLVLTPLLPCCVSQDVDDESKLAGRPAQARPAAAAARRRDEADARPTGPTMRGSMTGGGSDTDSSLSDSDGGMSSDGPGDVSLGEDSFSSGSSGASLIDDDDDGESDAASESTNSEDFGEDGSSSDVDF